MLVATSALSSARAAADTATILRDEWGVPYIYADREESGFYAVGYAQAQDKLERALRLYMFALGRRAELEGATGLTNDVRVRRWRHVEEARLAYSRLNPQLRKNYRYFIAGIQAYMQEHPSAVPAWAPRLEPYLPLLVERYVRWGDVIAAGATECGASGLPIPPTVAQLPSDPLYSNRASNAWTLSPWRTAMNAAILLGDPHGSFSGNRYEFFLHAGRIETMGHTDIGVALPILGHTRHVAWSWTSGAPDLSDCYQVDLTADAKAYVFDGRRVPLKRHTAVIAVKGEPPRTEEFLYTTHNGVLSPVVAQRENTVYAISSPYMHSWHLWDEEMYRQQFARNIDEFRDALSLLGHHGENVMAADSSGNTFYVRTGRTPRRSLQYDWSRPVPGNSSATAWQGIHPIADLVQIKNPPQGYMQNNNVPPRLMMYGSPLTPDRYRPYIYNTYTLPYEAGERPRLPRGDLANEALSRAYYVTSDRAIALALDQRWPYVGVWLDVLRDALDAHTAMLRERSVEYRGYADELIGFDGIADAGSVAALRYYAWRTAMAQTSFDCEGGLSGLIERVEAKKQISSADQLALLEAITVAIKFRSTLPQGEEATLGDVFRIGRGTQSWPMGGVAFKVGDVGYPTLRMTYFGAPDSVSGIHRASGGGHSLRLVIFTDPIESYSAVVWGASDDPSSPHYEDQAKLLSASRLKRNYFERRDLERHATRRLILVVGRH